MSLEDRSAVVSSLRSYQCNSAELCSPAGLNATVPLRECMYDGAPSVAISTWVSCRCMRFWKTRSRNLQATAVLTGIWPTFASTARAQRPVPKQQTFALLLVKHHECSLATAPPPRAKLLKTRAFRIEVRVATAPFSAGAPALPNVVTTKLPLGLALKYPDLSHLTGRLGDGQAAR